MKDNTNNYFEQTRIMGVLNVTPDSFSDGGIYTAIDKAIDQAIKMEEDGADIIDVGGESTRPGHEPISMEEELSRVIPVIKAIKERVNIPISIDTYKSTVAEQAIKAGASIINDIWGAKEDQDIAKIAAKYHVPIILMHNRKDMNYTSLIDDMIVDLEESIAIAKREGVKDKNIILDVGIGFAKTGEHNLVVLNHLERFVEMDYPILLGTSRKSFIGKILDVPAEERDIGTGATTCLAISQGVQIIRVHNVQINKQLALMMEAIRAQKLPVNKEML